MIPASDSATGRLRDELVARRDHLRLWLRPADEKTLGRAVSFLRSSFPSPREQDPRLVAQGYMLALAQIPAWAVEDAVKRILKGEMGALAFAPSAPEMADICLKITLPYRVELDKLSRILDAEIVPDANPAMVAKIAEAIKGSAPGGMNALDHWEKVVRPEIQGAGKPPPEDPAVVLERVRLKSITEPLPRLSPALASKVLSQP